MKRNPIYRLILLLLVVVLSACTGAAPAAEDGRPHVLATTGIVADVVRQVAGEYVRVDTLLPVGTDPHTFEPRPQDAAALADADLVFANGAGLEEFLQPLLESAGAMDRLVEVSDGITLLPFSGEDDHAGGDPHTWMDPNHVLVWVENIRSALAGLDPDHAAAYRANAEAYSASLIELDAWTQEQVARVPAANRNLVSDHAVFGYFAARYGFTQTGTITGSFSSGASPSAQELAVLEDAIRASGVPAIFVSKLENNDLADRVAADTGIPLVGLYHASLSQPGGEADSYLKLMRYNVSAIVEALK
jgi:ABC-type Zn uptake system ZnuABC Zn-binding protein ZnuA